MVACARMAAADEKIRAELAEFCGDAPDSFPSSATEILYRTHEDALKALDGHDALKKLMDKDPALGMRTAGVFLNRAARDPKSRETNADMVKRSVEVLEALDIAIRPEVVAILKAYSRGGKNRISQVGLS
jgi:hypothetical protein